MSYWAALGSVARLERDLLRVEERLAVPPSCPVCGTGCKFSYSTEYCPLCGEPVQSPPVARWTAFLWSQVERLRRFGEWNPACANCQRGDCGRRQPWQPPRPECPDWSGWVERRAKYIAKRVEVPTVRRGDVS